jgi:signal transduction histidine kinase
LKTFSRTGGGELQEADVVAGIETTLNLIAPLLKNRITVERHFARDIPKLVCNAGHLNQVFMNLLTNAAQAVKGEGVIRVEIDKTEDGNAICVTVTDSGTGIRPEVIQRITDPFFTTKDVGEGTGLGLWITENIIRAHGGTLRCVSNPGEGATFTVVLPLRAPETARHGLLVDGESSAASGGEGG